MNGFLDILAALSIGGSLMALVLLALRYIIFKRMPARVYYYLWLLVFLRFVLPVPGLLPAFSAGAGSDTAYVERGGEFRREYVLPSVPAREGALPVPQAEQAKELPQYEALQQGETKRQIKPMPDVKSLILAVWALGTALSFIYYLGGYLRFSSLIRKNSLRPEREDRHCYACMGPGKKPKLIRSGFVSTPMLMGFAHPLLVLPDGEYSREQLENIFLHELMHYSRRDIAYKWFAVLVLSGQWFNPLACVIRREINRACELSCDEMLIAGMDRAQKQAYGDTLISLASAGHLPAGIVATTFTMEKRDLKERLIRIMKFKERKLSALTALLLSLLILAGCGAVTGPLPTPESEPADPAAAAEVNIEVGEDGVVEVSGVDELLAAIAPGRSIRLEPGVYDLTEAVDYGGESENKYYRWEECYDGYELVISGVEGLSISGGGRNTTICTQPRYANVIKFEKSEKLALDDLVIGHTEEQGSCSGGVVYFDSCEDVNINACKLFGCGIIGVYAQNCKRVNVENSAIYECSYNAVYAVACHDVRVTDCDIHDNGEGMVQSIFTVDSSMGFAVVNSNIYANTALHLIDSRYSQQVSMLGCEVKENVFTEAVFWCDGYSVTVEDCSFELDHYTYYYDRGDGQAKLPPVDSEGNELSEEDLFAMNLRYADYEGPVQAQAVSLEENVNEDGVREVTVSTVDEFLAAIGNDTLIKLAADEFDLSTASDYGAFGSDHYYWINVYDGPGLVISGVKNLSIEADGAVIAAIPRYANVLGFVNCENISLKGFTAGHTQEPGSCAGGVLDFQNCNGISIDSCRLYGCGILGISAYNCADIYAKDTEIFDCSQGAISLYAVRLAKFENCDIHDCYSPEISLSDCSMISFNGQELDYGMYAVEDNKPRRFEY